jgi:hypothetical protein
MAYLRPTVNIADGEQMNREKVARNSNRAVDRGMRKILSNDYFYRKQRGGPISLDS